MTRHEIPKGCYSYNDLRYKLKINHAVLLSITRHPDCPVAGQYHSSNRYETYNFYNLNAIKKFMKTGKRVEVFIRRDESKEWEIPHHSREEQQFCRQAQQFYRLTAGVISHA